MVNIHVSESQVLPDLCVYLSDNIRSHKTRCFVKVPFPVKKTGFEIYDHGDKQGKVYGKWDKLLQGQK